MVRSLTVAPTPGVFYSDGLLASTEHVRVACWRCSAEAFVEGIRRVGYPVLYEQAQFLSSRPEDYLRRSTSV